MIANVIKDTVTIILMSPTGKICTNSIVNPVGLLKFSKCDKFHSRHLMFYVSGMVVSTKMLAASGIVGTLIEAVINSHDIYRFYQMLMDGRIDQDQFIELLVERLVIALCAQLGSLSGFCVASTPGYLIGGILGNIFGRVFGETATGYVVKFGASVVHFFENLIQEFKKGILPAGNHFHND